MEITELTIGQATIITVRGRVHIPAARKLKKMLLHLIETQKCHLILNCKGIETLSNEGVKTLVASLAAAKKWGGDLVLTSLSAHAQEVLRVSGSLDLFKVFPTDSAAVNFFSSPFL